MNAMSMIECLNTKIRELSQGGEMNNVNELLQRIREQMMSEFVKYKKDTEESVNKVSQLVSQSVRNPIIFDRHHLALIFEITIINNDPSAPQSPSGCRPVSHFCRPPPDTAC